MMPIMINKLMPFPTPRSVMRSPKYIISSVELVKIKTALNHQNVVGLLTAPGTETTEDAKYPGACTNVMAMVKNLVHWLIFFRPLSPSDCIFWMVGTARPINCMMMLAEM